MHTPDDLGRIDATQIVRYFTNGAGQRTAAVIVINGVELLARRSTFGGIEEIIISPWGPAQGLAEENPGWAVIDALAAAGHAHEVYEGISIAHNDRTVWSGPAIPGLREMAPVEWQEPMQTAGSHP